MYFILLTNNSLCAIVPTRIVYQIYAPLGKGQALLQYIDVLSETSGQSSSLQGLRITTKHF